jgi:uncharacterized membrane protein YqjE
MARHLQGANERRLMNPETEIHSTPPDGPSSGIPDLSPDPASKGPTHWREALLTLIASRVSIIQIESKEAAKEAAGRLAYAVALIICIFFTWALLLAGGIAALAAATSWPWFWIAIAAAGIHLLAAIGFARAAKAPGKATFTATKAEFQKDREWIENFQKTRKSDA